MLKHLTVDLATRLYQAHQKYTDFRIQHASTLERKAAFANRQKKVRKLMKKYIDV